MRTYRLRFIDDKDVDCITRFKAVSRDDAINIAKNSYGAVKILECWHVLIKGLDKCIN